MDNKMDNQTDNNYRVIEAKAEIKCSPEDFDFLRQFSWHIINSGYAQEGRRTLMHHMVYERMHPGTEFSRYLIVDHINNDKLDNRRENLQLLPASLNCFKNPRPHPEKKGSDLPMGVSLNEKNHRFVVQWTERRTVKYKTFTYTPFNQAQKREEAIAFRNEKVAHFLSPQTIADEIAFIRREEEEWNTREEFECEICHRMVPKDQLKMPARTTTLIGKPKHCKYCKRTKTRKCLLDGLSIYQKREYVDLVDRKCSAAVIQESFPQFKIPTIKFWNKGRAFQRIKEEVECFEQAVEARFEEHKALIEDCYYPDEPIFDEDPSDVFESITSEVAREWDGEPPEENFSVSDLEDMPFPE